MNHTRRNVMFISRSEEETMRLGETIGRIVQSGDRVGLRGGLGAGKTRLVQGMARGLGIDPAVVNSPTYVIANEYETGGGAAALSDVQHPRFLAHLDAYRLRGEEELDALGWDRWSPAHGAGSDGVIVAEWADRLPHAFGPAPNVCWVRLHTDDDGDGEPSTLRVIEVDVPEPWMQRPAWIDLAQHINESFVAPGLLPSGWARCPVSGRAVAPESPTFPFADEKCRLADLGKWMSGDYRL